MSIVADRRLGRVGSIFAIVVLAAAFVAGCNEGKETPRVDGSKSTAGTKSDGSAYAKERAKTAVLAKSSELPDSWRPVPVKSRLSGPPGKPEYCGVLAEPDPVRQSALTLYEQDPSQSRVLQYTFVSTKDAATDTMDRLVAAAGQCKEEGFTVTQAADFVPVGDGSIALDYVNPQGAKSRTVVFHAGDTIVVLVGYGQLDVPTEAVQAMAQTINRLLTG